MKNRVIFWVLLILTFISFLGFFSLLKEGHIPVYNKMNVILDAKISAPDDIIIQVNESYFDAPASGTLLNRAITGKVDTLEIFVKEGVKVDGILIFNNLKPHYFKDFSEFKREDLKFCPEKICRTTAKYTPPESVKYSKGAKSYNFNSKLNTLCSFIENSFSGRLIFLLPYILLFLTIFYWGKLDKKPVRGAFIAVLLFISGALLRWNGLFDYLPFGDEYYSLEFAKAPFQDPGNPPLFYILLWGWFKIFGVSLTSIKIFPFLCGFLALLTMWLFLKKTIGLKEANAGLFLGALNFSLIYFSTECRSYILQAAFSPVLIYYLFKILDENKPAYYAIYGVLAALALNLHYFEALFIFANFLYAAVYLILKKRYKDILKLFGVNLIGLAFFLPFFLKTALDKALLAPEFNLWIPDITPLQIKKCVLYLFGGQISLIFALYFLIKNLKNRLAVYCFYQIFAVIALAVALSYLIRPMLVERYLILLLPVFIIYVAACKKSAPVFFLWFLLIQAGNGEKYNARKGVIEIPMSFSAQYFDRNGGNVHCILNTFLSSQKDLNDYRGGIKYSAKTLSEVPYAVTSILENEKDAIIFTSILPKDKKPEENYQCYFNSASDMCVWKITN